MKLFVATALAVLLVGGCASVPTGPSVMALPGSGKDFGQFLADDADCRQFAARQLGGTTANQAATDAGLRSAAVGTAVGAVAGAAIGGRDAAAVGAGTGLLVGSVAGSGAAQSSAYVAQHRYDNAYIQCMYAKGQKVPVPASQAASRSSGSAAAAPAAGNFSPPPPPPGWAPR